MNTYLNDHRHALPPTTYFNSHGRAYPDVAAYGSNYFVYLDGKINRESGTSASAPVFAAMVTLWNDMRFAYGKGPMGFINPFLYKIAGTNPEAFNDVTTGNNVRGNLVVCNLSHCRLILAFVQWGNKNYYLRLVLQAVVGIR